MLHIYQKCVIIIYVNFKLGYYEYNNFLIFFTKIIVEGCLEVIYLVL